MPRCQWNSFEERNHTHSLKNVDLNKTNKTTVDLTYFIWYIAWGIVYSEINLDRYAPCLHITHKARYLIISQRTAYACISYIVDILGSICDALTPVAILEPQCSCRLFQKKKTMLFSLLPCQFLPRIWYWNHQPIQSDNGFPCDYLSKMNSYIQNMERSFIYIYIYIYIIHCTPIGQSQTQICPTWSSNISCISFDKSCIGQLADNCPI